MMPDRMDPESISSMEPSYGSFSKGRKSSQNTRAIAQTVYERLREGILSAELRPNKRLVEDELADWLKVSRTPIREALLRLEQEGLVERDRGWLVREHDPGEIRARLECRLAIEGYASRLAAIHRTDAELEELQRLADRMEEPGIPTTEFNELNDRFHRAITAAARNSTLSHLHAQTKLNYWDLNVPVMFSLETSRKIHEQHRALIGALAAHNGEAAESIARRHVQQTMEVVLASFGAFASPAVT